MSENPPLIFVDLIEMVPLTFEQHSDRYRGFDNPEDRYHQYIGQFQPWRWIAKSADNQRKMGRSTERYFNEADCRHAIKLLFGSGSNVYMRATEQGDELLRLAL